MKEGIESLRCVVGKEEIFLSFHKDCVTTTIKEALFQFIKHIGQIEDIHNAKLKEEQDSKIE